MAEALLWGAVAASSLVLGALIGLRGALPNVVVGLVLGFGAGALISAVAFELAEDGLELGGAGPVAAGLALGALAYYGADAWLERGGPDTGSALALGAFLDGLPEQLVLGLGIALGDGVSVSLLAAIFVSNLPEAVGSAANMRAAGRRPRVILRTWLLVALACTLASVVGFGVADVLSDELKGAANGFAAGALLVMLVDSMIPEATRLSGRTTGLVTTLGFALAAGLANVT